MKLIVIQPFGKYKRGQVITDDTETASVLKAHKKSVRKMTENGGVNTLQAKSTTTTATTTASVKLAAVHRARAARAAQQRAGVNLNKAANPAKPLKNTAATAKKSK